MSKKILSLLLVLVMLVGCFASCGLFKKDDKTDEIPGGNNTTNTTCEHVYDNDCDATCNKCGKARQAAVCADNDGDGYCDSCNANLVCAHEYDSCLDADCNKCGETRVPGHKDWAGDGWLDHVCGVCGEEMDNEFVTFKEGAYDTTTTVMPSNWNELTYADGNDTQIMSYIGSSFFTYDYKFLNDQKFNNDGSINKAGIIDGAFSVHYDAATKLEDVTATVDAKWNYTAEQKAEGGYAWKITLRDDLKWHDGTPITAADFVYSMQAQLDPAFMNFRGNLYYDTLMIKNSRNYFFQNQEATYPTVGSRGYANNAAALADGVVIYIDAYEFYGAKGYVDAEGNYCPQWVAYNDETIYNSVEAWADPENDEIQDPFSGAILWQYFFAPGAPYGYDKYVEVGAAYETWLGVKVENLIRDVKWEDVGIYSIDSENAIVICLDKAYSFLNDDGSLSVWSAYYMSSLPLVKRDLYESCKKAPEAGSTLWTTNYNSSLATTASWGPYMLTKFEAGSDYVLTRNNNWHGYSMPMNQNQYNITTINCRKLDNAETQWMGFLAGEFDDSALDTFNVEEYLDSKYVSYSEGSTGTYGMQLFSDLSKLKESENNNGILAIAEFRQAFNLAINRSDVIEKIWPGTATPCFGLLNVAYYYDIEGATTLADGGKYRNSVQAKAGVLRAYGYTYDAATDTWSINDMSGLTIDEAYETLTGYNLTLAKQKMVEAINILTANAEYYGYNSSKNITLVYGSSADTDKQRFRATYLQELLDDLTKDTALEGKIEVKFDASAGAQWAEAFRDGKTQIGFGYGFQGNAFNPFDIIGAFVNPDDDLNYHQYWNTGSIDMTLTMPEGDYEGAGETITMSIQNWYFCLNGLAEVEKQAKKYNWGEGFAPSDARLTILSALEEAALKESRSIMLIADSGGSFLGAQFANFSDSYNTFMGFGGLQYMEVVYTDLEWADYIETNNGDLSNEYKKSE